MQNGTSHGSSQIIQLAFDTLIISSSTMPTQSSMYRSPRTGRLARHRTGGQPCEIWPGTVANFVSRDLMLCRSIEIKKENAARDASVIVRRQTMKRPGWPEPRCLSGNPLGSLRFYTFRQPQHVHLLGKRSLVGSILDRQITDSLIVHALSILLTVSVNPDGRLLLHRHAPLCITGTWKPLAQSYARRRDGFAKRDAVFTEVVASTLSA